MLNAARRNDSGGRADLEAAMAKRFATELAQEAALEAMRTPPHRPVPRRLTLGAGRRARARARRGGP
jgi:alkylation response protein AidB-like acyl-CoA dehydrogenase